MIDCKGSHFGKEIIVWGVRWCVADPIRDRQLEEMMSERGAAIRSLRQGVVRICNKSIDSMRPSRPRPRCPGSGGPFIMFPRQGRLRPLTEPDIHQVPVPIAA